MAAELTTHYRPSPAMIPLSVGLALLLLFTCQVSGRKMNPWKEGCPDDVNKPVEACFTPYRQDLHKVKTSPKRLCCGMDVETLRSFCSSFEASIECVRDGKNVCPRSSYSQLDAAARNQLLGMETSLRALCKDDTLYESYSVHQTCLTKAGPSTNRCLQRFLNTSNTVTLLTRVDPRPIAEFCSDMRRTLQCIQLHLSGSCSEHEIPGASILVAKLVKSMVRDSNKCDYSVVTKAPVSRQGQPSPSSHDGSWHGSGSASVQPELSALLSVCVAVVVWRTIFMSS